MQWVRGTVSEVEPKAEITVKYGERTRVLDLQSTALNKQLRALTLGLPMLKKRYAVGDLVEIFSTTYGGWLPGTVQQVLGDDVRQHELAVEYSDRTTIVDLHDLDLTKRFRLRLDPVHVNAVFDSLHSTTAANSALTKLDISDNRIGVDGARQLGLALKISTVTALVMADNQLGPEGTALIAAALGCNSCITAINLRGNLIGDAGCQALAAG